MTAALVSGAYRSGPVIAPEYQRRADLTLQALAYLSQVRGTLVARSLIAIAAHGPCSLQQLAQLVQAPLTTTSDAIRAVSTGYFRKREGVVPPRIPHLFIHERTGERATKRIALTRKGREIAEALLGIDSPIS